MRATSLWMLLASVLAPAAPTFACALPAQEAAKRVLVAYAHDPNAPGLVLFSGELKGAILSGLPTRVEFYDEYLDLDRFPDADRSPQLARYFSDKYQGFRPDVVVAEGSLALRFSVDRLGTLFPGVPIVYGNVFEPVVDFASLPANVTGIRHPLPFRGTLELARALQPEATRAVIVGGSSATDSAMLAAALREAGPLRATMRVDVLQDWTYDSLIEELRRIPPRSFVILSSFRQDRRGQHFNSGDLIASLTSVASVPVYGIARNWVGDGVVGGRVLHFAEDGRRTGELVARVLRRAPGEPVPPVEFATLPLVADWRQLQRWGLSEDRLPPGTEILFRPPSAWQRYRIPILAVGGILVVESLLIGLLLAERARRLRAQRAIEAQVAYEQMMAGLTTDTVQHAHGELSTGLDDALRRVGRFAGANAAILVVNPDDASQPARHLFWSEAEDWVRGDARREAVRSTGPGGRLLDIPLEVEGTAYGVLRLSRAGDGAWSGTMRARLAAAGELFAAALARARAERALERTRAQVEHVARVSTVTGLAAAVSHELRQPLTAIRNNAEAGALLLARTPPEVDEAREILRDIIRDDARASEVIETFRGLLRGQGPTRTTVDLNDLCRQTAGLLGHEAAARHARIELDLQSDPAAVRGDRVQLQQVIMNLLLNALEAVSASAGDRRVVLATAASEGGVDLSVQDSGPGLRPEVRARLFEPYFTTKPHGLGLGLSIVRTIVDRHGGGLRVGSAPDGGARFTVTLPTDAPGDRTGERSAGPFEGLPERKPS